MRSISCATAMLVLGLVTPAAHADQSALHSKPAAEIRVALAQPAPTVTRGQVAACANLAAIRALGAKAAGSDAPTQSRILDLTFVLCLTGTATAS